MVNSTPALDDSLLLTQVLFMSMALKLIAESKEDKRLALQDIWWALLNSNEFILDH